MVEFTEERRKLSARLHGKNLLFYFPDIGARLERLDKMVVAGVDDFDILRAQAEQSSDIFFLCMVFAAKALIELVQVGLKACELFIAAPYILVLGMQLFVFLVKLIVIE